MKRRGLVLPTLLTLLLTGIALVQAGWFSGPRSLRCGVPCRVRPPAPANPPDPLSTDAIQRWRSGQPQHWRACTLQR